MEEGDKKFALGNINHPTSGYWNKVQVACVTASAFMGSYGALADDHTWIWIGGILGLLGTVIPVFIKTS